MAITVASFQAASASALETVINTALAALTNPIFRGLFASIWVEPRREGTELRALLTTASGGSSLATPFVFKTFSGTTLAAAQAAAQAFITANSGYFFSAVRLLFVDVDEREPTYIAWVIYNTTGGASANYLPL